MGFFKICSNCSKKFFIITVFWSRVWCILSVVVHASELCKLFLDLIKGKGLYKQWYSQPTFKLLTLGNNWKVAGLDSCAPLPQQVTDKCAEKEIHLCVQVIRVCDSAYHLL